FQIEEPGLEHAEPMPEVPDPETLPTRLESLGDLAEKLGRRATAPRPIDIRYVTTPPWVSRDQGPRDARSQVWMRADGKLPDDELLHVCVLTYASDMTLLDSILLAHGTSWLDRQLMGASLDHAMWFHRPFRADEWVLYDCTSPSASGGRGLAIGRFFSRDGQLIATVVQEGLVRVRD
ncbi:MAG: acyl-CoA thioesterase, partial [Pseudonocardiaceae bacterium]